MIFSSMANPPRFSVLRRTLAGLVAAGAAALVASCGGGTSQQEAFVPLRYFAFGDETSSLESVTGRKYGVNGLTTDGRLDCAAQPNWTQQLANIYGFAFAECNPTALGETRARMLAIAGAKVADVSAQVEAQVAAGGFRDKDLATVLAGANDVLELYAQYPARSEASLLADARDRGGRLAQIVNRLVALGVKVVISNVPDMGVSPFGLAEKAAFNDIDRSALLTRLTTALNEQLGVNVLLDGRFVGLVQADLRLQAIYRFPAAFGLSNATTGICTVSLPLCTTATLVPESDASTWVWADATRLAPGGQNQLAQLAVDRARRNPF
jgi:phospholipase/lecithinase/hemolysin